MEITEAQYERIKSYLPTQRGNVRVSNLDVLNAFLYVLEHGCKWRGLPDRFGNWHTIYTRMNRWSKNGVLDRVFRGLQDEGIIRMNLEVVSLDSTIVKVHPDGMGALKKRGPRRSAGPGGGGWTTKIHMVAADAQTAVMFSLSAGQDHDAAHGRRLLERIGVQQDPLFLVMDRAYEGDETRQLALDLGYTPVVPPTVRRRNPWVYDQEVYKRRNEVERLFRRLKEYRRVFSRYDKLDVVYLGFITFALITETLRSVNRP